MEEWDEIVFVSCSLATDRLPGFVLEGISVNGSFTSSLWIDTEYIQHTAHGLVLLVFPFSFDGLSLDLFAD